MQHAVLPPGSVAGIIGGGQLGRMLAMAAAKIGLRTCIYCDEPDSPAAKVSGSVFVGDYSDKATLQSFGKACDVITFEFENIPNATLEAAARLAPVFPPPRAAAVAQDRVAEKAFIQELSLPVAPYCAITSNGDLGKARDFLSQTAPHGAILKRARFGYDGKGQINLAPKAVSELDGAFAKLGSPCVLEARVDFAAETSLIAVRGQGGEFACYDMPLNIHRGGILRESHVPCGLPPELQEKARDYARKLAENLEYVGVLAVEFFVSHDYETLMVNELAPRVHNSGHWTLDACTVSQFENHIRAICGWPLGSTTRHSDAVMHNLLGDEVSGWQQLTAVSPALSLHLYGKTAAEPGRKMGHVTKITPLSE